MLIGRMGMKRKEAIVVEGRYDKAALSGVVDTLILDTAGFGVFKDGERLAFLRKLAKKRGLMLSENHGKTVRHV